MHRTTPRRRFGAIAVLTAAMAFAFASSSLAATLSNSGGTLTYTGAGTADNNVSFSEVDTGIVEVTTDDGDPITDPGTCTPDDPDTYTCQGVTSVVANGEDGDDNLNAEDLDTVPATLNGGSGEDGLYGGGGADALNGGGDGDYLSGGNANDTLQGGDGNDQLNGDRNDDTLNGDGGQDQINGEDGNDNLQGGDGIDSLEANEGNDTLTGGAGGDSLYGDDGSDTLTGGDGDDYLRGGGDDDTVNGDGGNDSLYGDDGKDVVNGGAGDDELNNFLSTSVNCGDDEPDAGDTYNGGSGLDTFSAGASSYNCDTDVEVAIPVTVTLDGQANDGAPGENDQVADIENLNGNDSCVYDAATDECTRISADTLVGSDGPNTISGLPGNDTIDGGRGNDLLYGDEGDDTINAQDGFADLVSCGDGNDTANVDTLDTVSDDCETVNRVNVGNANDVPEDAPPTITISSPASGATVPTKGATTITAAVSDDKGISQVLYVANGRIVCTTNVAPYSCAYTPTGADVGRTQLTAIAIDTAQQTATALRTVLVSRFAPGSFTQKSKAIKATKASRFRFQTSGKVVLPAGVTPAQGCSGVVSVQVKAGSKTISTRRATVKADCTYKTTVGFKSKKRFSKHSKLKFTARFGGNTTLTRSTASTKTVKVK